ncbi:hypothetical protein Tco_0797336, partial [Tanacetum coccineum]
YGYIKNHKKTVKNGQARTRESEEYKKKPKIQSRSQKCQAFSQNQSNNGQQQSTTKMTKPTIFHFNPQNLTKCMRTRSQARNRNRRQQQLTAVIVEEPEFPMAMAQMLQAPIEGYEDAIVVPPINANNFELKQPLINLVQCKK